ncbi:MAG: Lsr2 family protein [Propionibacteriaceae bacterium]|nr:Lsr2 family protein [Propionibacteriaceae bacterium]
MAIKTVVHKVDDIDGSPATKTFTFSWAGYKYHIDLNDAHAASMKADFDRWAKLARRERYGGRQKAVPAAAAAPAAKAAPKAAAKPAAKAAAKTKAAAKPHRRVTKKNGPSPSEVRAWATEQGIKVADRGRIAPALVEQFLAAKAAIKAAI